MTTANNMILTISTATIEKQICEEINTRLKLNNIEDAVYWLDQVIGEDNSVIDYLTNQISPLIDSSLDIKIPQGFSQNADNTNMVKFNGGESLFNSLKQYNEFMIPMRSEWYGAEATFKKVYANKRTGIIEFCDGKLNSGFSQLWLNGVVQYAEKKITTSGATYYIHIENEHEPFVVHAYRR